MRKIRIYPQHIQLGVFIAAIIVIVLIGIVFLVDVMLFPRVKSIDQTMTGVRIQRESENYTKLVTIQPVFIFFNWNSRYDCSSCIFQR